MNARPATPVSILIGMSAALAACAPPAPTPRGADSPRRIVFVAGPDSHAYGEHDFPAGCRYLAQCLNNAVPGVQAEVVEGAWPVDPSTLDGAAAVLIYSDGLNKHLLRGHTAALDALQDRGTGVGFLHYACAVEKEELGDAMLRWIGGHYEKNWSVNPFWDADFRQLPSHPVLHGVQPFVLHDEWYFNLRFRGGMEGIAPLLTAIPPDAARSGKDGPHSGNPYVRGRLGQPETVAWAAENTNGARGFGLTGCHYYWNLGHPGLRKLLLNAALWLANVDVPASGVDSPRPSLVTLQHINAATPDGKWTGGEVSRWEALLNQWRNPPATTPDRKLP